VTVDVNPSGLSPGTYNGSVSIVSPGAANSPQVAAVSFTVSGPTITGPTTPLIFTSQIGAPAPGPQSITVVTDGSSISLNAAVSTMDGGTWLGVTPLNAATPASFSISVNPAALLPGSYAGTVSFTSPQAPNTVLNVPVRLTVVGVQFSAPNGTLTFTSFVGRSASPAQTVAVSTAGSPITVSAAASTSTGANWLSVTPPSGSTPVSFTISASSAGLQPGTYSGAVTIGSPQASNGPVVVPVQLLVSTLPLLSVSPASINFSWEQGASLPTAQTFNISTNGSAVNYALTTAGGSWLSLSAASITTNGAVTVSVDPTGLAPGTYSATVSISSTLASNSPQTVNVNLTVTPANISVSPSAVSFAYSLCGALPGPQTASISSDLAFAFTAVADSSWISVTPSGTLPGSLSIGVNPALLTVGNYSGTVTAFMEGTSPLVIPVSLNIGSGCSFSVLPSALGFQYVTGGATPPDQTVSLTGIADTIGFSVQVLGAGSGASQWLAATPSSGNTPATLTVSVNTTRLTAGDYTAFIAVSPAGSQPSVVAVTLSVANPIRASVAPGLLNLTYRIGDPRPAVQVLSVNHSVDFAVVASTGQTWLTADANFQQNPGTVNVHADPTGLSAGLYSASLRVVFGHSAALTQTVPVQLNVIASAGVNVSPQTITINYQIGGPAPLPVPVSVRSSNAPVEFSVGTLPAPSSGSWLSAAPSAGRTPGVVNLTVNPAGLAPGSYTGSVVVTDPVSSQFIPARLNVYSREQPGLAISSLNPSSAAAGSAGFQLTVNGIGLLNGAIVYWNSTALNTVSVDGSGGSVLVATVPATLAASAGTANITVELNGHASAAALFTVSSLGSFDLVSPGDHAQISGTTVQLTWTPSDGATSFEVNLQSGGTSTVAGVTSSTNFTLTGLIPNAAYTWTVTAKGSGGSVQASESWSFSVSKSATPIGNQLYFVPLAPCHLVDTRGGLSLSNGGEFGGPSLAAASTRTFHPATGQCPNIPATAQAYALNISVLPKTTLGYLSVGPSGQSLPVVSTLNDWRGGLVSNFAIVPAGSDGGVSVFVTDATDLMVDISGYFDPTASVAGMAYYPVKPCRVSDTRNTPGALGGPPLIANQARLIPVATSPCLPASANAAAFSLNASIVPSSQPVADLLLWASDAAQPAKVVNLTESVTTVVADAVIVKASSNGSVFVSSTDPTDFFLDVNGYFASPGNAGALYFHPVTPCRVWDSRDSNGPFGGPLLAASETRTIPVLGSTRCPVPATAQAYSVNVTVVPPGGLGFITLLPTAQPFPGVSTLNDYLGDVISNAAIVPAGANGSIDLLATHQTHAFIDINGYFSAQ
jgi:hypothetical protein